MRKCANIQSYIRRPLVIYDFATAPFWISLYMREILFPFLSVQVRMRRIHQLQFLTCGGGLNAHQHQVQLGGGGGICLQSLIYIGLYCTLNIYMHNSSLPLQCMRVRPQIYLHHPTAPCKTGPPIKQRFWGVGWAMPQRALAPQSVSNRERVKT